MIWWLKARLAHTVLAGGALLFAFLTCAVQSRTMVLPSFVTTGGESVLLAFFVPLVFVGALAHCLDSRLESAEMSGVRPVLRMDTGLILATVATILVASDAGSRLLGTDVVLETGRDVAFLTGLMLAARAFSGRAGIIVPLAWVFAVIFFGHRIGTGLRFHAWAVTAQPSHSVSAAVATGIAFVVGILLNQFVPRKSL